MQRRPAWHRPLEHSGGQLAVGCTYVWQTPWGAATGLFLLGYGRTGGCVCRSESVSVPLPRPLSCGPQLWSEPHSAYWCLPAYPGVLSCHSPFYEHWLGPGSGLLPTRHPHARWEGPFRMFCFTGWYRIKEACIPKAFIEIVSCFLSTPLSCSQVGPSLRGLTSASLKDTYYVWISVLVQTVTRKHRPENDSLERVSNPAAKDIRSDSGGISPEPWEKTFYFPVAVLPVYKEGKDAYLAHFRGLSQES